MSDQMGDDLGIGLGLKFMAESYKTFLELKVIFDDPIVNDDDFPRRIAVRVSVFLGRTAVRRPSRVADSVRAVERLQSNAFLKITKLPFRTPQFKMLFVVHHGDSRRIISAILELSQAVDDQRDDLFISNVTYNSAHKNN
jgi:hypothetical protein